MFKSSVILKTLLVLTVVLLTGCFGRTVKPEVVTVVEYKPYDVPATLFKRCIPAKFPFTKEAYLQLEPHEREYVLSNYIIVLYGVTSKCDQRQTVIKEHLDKMDAVIRAQAK